MHARDSCQVTSNMAAIQQRVLAAFNARAATQPNLAAFEHDVSVFIQDVGKLKSKRLYESLRARVDDGCTVCVFTWAFICCPSRANNAFKLWSKHESKVSSTVLSRRVVHCGDISLQAQVSHSCGC